jgi:hypothetical protein
MSTVAEQPNCPHCGSRLQAFSLPDDMGWEDKYHWACFNDECPYFVSGWEWMRDNYNLKASYRYRVVALASAKCMPLAVPNELVLLDRIIEDPETLGGIEEEDQR